MVRKVAPDSARVPQPVEVAVDVVLRAEVDHTPALRHQQHLVELFKGRLTRLVNAQDHDGTAASSVVEETHEAGCGVGVEAARRLVCEEWVKDMGLTLGVRWVSGLFEGRLAKLVHAQDDNGAVARFWAHLQKVVRNMDLHKG